MERAMILVRASREQPFMECDLAFTDAMEDHVEALNGL